MPVHEIHKNDIGTVFELTMKDGENIVDISNPTSIEIHFEKPTKPTPTVVVKTASLKTDGTDGIIYYISTTDDLDTLGKWRIQGKVQLATGTWSSDISTFRVYDNLLQS